MADQWRLTADTNQDTMQILRQIGKETILQDFEVLEQD